jgi:hypothetical protein
MSEIINQMNDDFLLPKSKVDLTVSEKDHFMIQLRHMLFDASAKTIEMLYYIHKYPETFVKEMVADKLYKNKGSAVVMITRLLEDEELIEDYVTEVIDSDGVAREKVCKRLKSEIRNRIVDTDMMMVWTIRIKK